MSDNTNNGFPVPEEPLTREEEYLSAIAGVTASTEIPEKPLTRVEAYLNKIVENGGGGGGGGFTPTDAQLDAMNSGITSEDVEQISTNKNNISNVQTSLAVGSSDNGKVLTASYSGGTGSYAWVTPSGGGAVSGVKGSEETNYRTGNVSISAANVGAIPTTEKGANNGVAALDSNGKIAAETLKAGALVNGMTATTQETSDDSTKVATTAFVHDVVDLLPSPMVFEGSLGTGGTITTLPTASSSNKGYVYKVITAGTYASQSAKIGDTFISDGSAWVLIPSGDEPSGTVTNVAVANGGGLTVSGSPITTSGTITVGHSNSVTAKSTSSLKKFTYDAYGHVTGSSELSTAESNALASGITSTDVAQITTNANNIISITNPTEELFIGEFVQGGATSTESVSWEEYRICSKNIVAFPYNATRKIKVKLNANYVLGIRAGKYSNNLSENLFWFADGDEITLNDNCNYYRLSLANADPGTGSHRGTKIHPNELTTADLHLIVKSNSDTTKADISNVDNARYLFSTTAPNEVGYLPTIAHTSDLHGDIKRCKNFVKFCEEQAIDCACVTGDIVSYSPSSGIEWFQSIVNNTNIQTAICTGNHDVESSDLTDSGVYDFMFSNIATKLGNTTGKTWYYKDISAKKLRIISINLYQYGGSNRYKTHFTDDQLSWLVSTLNSTPADYGVILLEHAPQKALAKDSTYGVFYQDTRLYNDTHSDVTGTPIYDIIDAFIGKTTISQTYTQTGSPSSVSVSGDFSGVNSGVEFIAHLTGHFHEDTICYVPNTTAKQLMLNVTCGCAKYGDSAYPYLADLSDQSRNNLTTSQDSFNIYAIDRANKAVNIVRIGNDSTYELKERKVMIIPYAD